MPEAATPRVGAGLPRFLASVIMLCTLAGAATWISGAMLVEALLPATRWSLDRIDDRIGTTALSVEQGRSETVVRMRSAVSQPIVIGTAVLFPTGADWFDIATPLFGLLVPFVLAVGFAGAWPGALPVRALRIGIAAALAVAWLAIDLPLSLHGFVWGALRDAHAPGTFYPSILWLDFMHSGGRLAVGVSLAALACLALRGSRYPARP